MKSPIPPSLTVARQLPEPERNVGNFLVVVGHGEHTNRL
ncbi:hypothetical protein J2T14_004085 [Paenibacillus harenae]|nr:hypothetical protein [Paenibacillus harenae]